MVRNYKIYIIFLSLFLMGVSLLPVYSDEIEDIQVKINETKSDIEAKNKELEKISQDINNIINSNMSVYAKIYAIESRKKDSQELIEKERKDLELIQSWVDEKNKQIDKKRSEMISSTTLMYKMSRITLLDRLWSLTDIKYLGYESFIFKNRLSELEHLADLKTELEKNAELISATEELLKKQQKLYDESLIPLYNQRAQIQQELLAKQQIQQAINQEVMSLNTSLSSLSAQLQQAMLLKAQQSNSGSNPSSGSGDTVGGTSSQTPGKSSYAIYLDGDLVADNLLGPIRLVPANGDKNSILKLNNSDYTLYYNVLEFNSNSNLFIINELPMQLYLYGLGEMPSSWHIEALKAQAIAGRTYAIKNWGKRTNYGYNLRDDTFDQNFVGAYKIFASYGSNWKNAVDQTNKQVITYNGEVINAYYHSTSGGHTLASEEVWSSALPYTRAESDWHQVNGVWKSYGSASPWAYKMWGRGAVDNNGNRLDDTIDNDEMIDLVNASIYLNQDPNSSQRQNEIVRADLSTAGLDPAELVEALNGQDFKSVYGDLVNVLSIYNNNSSAIDETVRKTNFIRVVGSKGTIDIDAGIFYTVFNSRAPGALNIYYSNLWTVVNENGSWNFYTRGYPHRVGMSQYGAEGRAEAGQTYDQILKAYYRGTSLGTADKGDIRIGITKIGSTSVLVTPYTNTSYKILNNGSYITDLPYGATLKIIRTSN